MLLPDPSQRVQPFQRINWRLTSRSRKTHGGDANQRLQSMTMNSAARCWKKIFCHSANATSVESPTNPPQPSSSSGLLKKTSVFSIGILIEEGQLVKCGNIPYSGKSVPELSIILQVLTVHFLLVRHFVPKVFSTELWLEESKVVVRLAVKEAYVVCVFVWVLLLISSKAAKKGLFLQNLLPPSRT